MDAYSVLAETRLAIVNTVDGAGVLLCNRAVTAKQYKGMEVVYVWPRDYILVKYM